jgi:uncharacterized damage-inducible protein DinB
MELDIEAIRDPRVRQFYEIYWPQRRILHDFYQYLPDEQYDYRIVDRPGRRADSPRESLAHILYVHLMYINGIRAGSVEFGPMGVEHYRELPKERLLGELERIERETYEYLTGEEFDSNRPVKVFWGGETDAINVLYALRDHDILHVGWNLAIMDHLNVPRFQSLADYWGP